MKAITSEGPIELTVVPNELEAAELVGYLGANGVEAHFQAGGGTNWLGAELEGAQQIWVRAEDIDRARELLAATQ